jgi:hypothetical protein
VVDREARRRADVLLAPRMDNSCILVARADTSAPPESREVGAQTPAEATPGTRASLSSRCRS